LQIVQEPTNMASYGTAGLIDFILMHFSLGT